MVLKWLRRMWPSAMAAPVGMSARRGIASVSMKPRFGIVREKASFLITNSQRERALFVFKNMSILVKICAIIIYMFSCLSFMWGGYLARFFLALYRRITMFVGLFMCSLWETRDAFPQPHNC